MSNIVVLGFESQYGAQGMLDDVQKWQEEGLIDVEDAVIAYAGPSGNVELEHTHHSKKGKWGLGGGAVGLVAGTIVGGPLLGLVVGATAGVLKGKSKDKKTGLDDEFVKTVSSWVRPGHSALFLLVRQADREQIREQVRPLRAQVLSTSLDPEQERTLREAFAEEEYDL
jgi:uncharacterized membrane protein